MGKKRPLKFGPGAFVTAAFIGPGTVTTCVLAGSSYGYALLWGLLFSVVATFILQEMAARLGIISGAGLGEALRKHVSHPVSKIFMSVLVITAIGIGNAAYEAGNLLGAAIGLSSLFKDLAINQNIWSLIIGGIAFILLGIGKNKALEKILIGLVLLMSVTFISTAIWVGPDWKEIANNFIRPQIPSGSLVTLVGLIGTTIVPYNLFLYASVVSNKYVSPEDLGTARKDLLVYIVLGGLISMSVVIAAATVFFGQPSQPETGGDLGLLLEPLLGSWSIYFISIGLIAAGMTSAITAPLAAAYALTGLMGWQHKQHRFQFNAIWMIVLLTGIFLSLMGSKPLSTILIAQAANGILLPIIAVYLLAVMNNRNIVKSYRNNTVINIAGVIVVLITVFLGLKSLISVINKWL